jgi:transcriptional regulator with XRE-family HTH domain
MATGTASLHTDSDKVRMRNEIREQIVAKLFDKEYRDIFVSEQINTGLAFQLRTMREAKGWTQSELGEKVRMAQSRISLMEDANYSRYSLNTLKRLGSTFDVALVVRFEPFSKLVDHFAKLNSSALNVTSFEADEFRAESSPSGTLDRLNVALRTQFGKQVSGTYPIPVQDTFAGSNVGVGTATFSFVSVTADEINTSGKDWLMRETNHSQVPVASPMPANIMQQMQERKERAA